MEVKTNRKKNPPTDLQRNEMQKGRNQIGARCTSASGPFGWPLEFASFFSSHSIERECFDYC